jgi:hypothetical protein
MTAALALWSWKAALYLGVVLLLAFRLAAWKRRAKAAEGALAQLQVDVKAIRQEARKALAEGIQEREALRQQIASMTPPEDAEGAIAWLATQGGGR